MVDKQAGLLAFLINPKTVIGGVAGYKFKEIKDKVDLAERLQTYQQKEAKALVKAEDLIHLEKNPAYEYSGSSNLLSGVTLGIAGSNIARAISGDKVGWKSHAALAIPLASQLALNKQFLGDYFPNKFNEKYYALKLKSLEKKSSIEKDAKVGTIAKFISKHPVGAGRTIAAGALSAGAYAGATIGQKYQDYIDSQTHREAMNNMANMNKKASIIGDNNMDYLDLETEYAAALNEAAFAENMYNEAIEKVASIEKEAAKERVISKTLNKSLNKYFMNQPAYRKLTLAQKAKFNAADLLNRVNQNPVAAGLATLGAAGGTAYAVNKTAGVKGYAKGFIEGVKAALSSPRVVQKSKGGITVANRLDPRRVAAAAAAAAGVGGGAGYLAYNAYN